MASGSPKHHMDRLGHRLGDRSRNPALAPKERIGTRHPIKDAGISHHGKDTRDLAKNGGVEDLVREGRVWPVAIRSISSPSALRVAQSLFAPPPARNENCPNSSWDILRICRMRLLLPVSRVKSPCCRACVRTPDAHCDRWATYAVIRRRLMDPPAARI